MKNLKVLMIADDFPPLICGIGDYSACIARALASKGANVTVVTKQVPGLQESEKLNGVFVRRVARGWFMSDIKPILNIADEIGSNTIIHIQYSSRSGYYKRLMINFLPFIIRLLRPKYYVVLTLHGFHEHRFRWRLRVTPMLVAPHARIFVHSKDQAMISRWLKPSIFHHTLIPIASNIPVASISISEKLDIRKQLGFHEDDRIIVYFGDIRPDKGFDTLLRVVDTVRSTDKAVRLLIVSNLEIAPVFGAEYERTIRDELRRATNEKWAIVEVAPKPERVSLLLRVADLGVFPFTMGASENRGSLLAAIVNGLPIITTKGQSTPDRFEEHYGVEIVPAGDESQLASCIEKFVCCEDARNKLGKKALNAAKQISWEAIALATIDLYQTLQREK
jgi:glycosyltransferase involved in cell wall biosynthesis